MENIKNPESGSSIEKRNPLNRALSHVGEKRVRQPRLLQRQQSLIDFEDLIVCELCHRKLEDHRMLYCQHTFCKECLDSHYMSNNSNVTGNKNAQGSEKRIFAFNKKKDVESTVAFISCPVCHDETPLKNGCMSINELPKNMQVEKLLKIVAAQNDSPQSTYRCVKCQTLGCNAGQSCLHCMQDFCNICWSEHQLELKTSLSNLLKQLSQSNVHLEHKTELLETRLGQLVDFIEATTLSRIEEIKEQEQVALDEVKMLKERNEEQKNNILERIDILTVNINRNLTANDEDKVIPYMNFHNETSKVLKDIQHFAEEKFHFNPDTFNLEKEENAMHGLLLTSKSFAYSQNQYKMKNSSKPKLVWEKCPRPGHVAIPPWDSTNLYISTTDNRSILVMSIDKLKLLETISSSEMLYAQGLAFSADLEEMYVSDKWKHCVHVFSKAGEYLRFVGGKGNGREHLKNPDGIAIARRNQLFVCDTGHDRVAIFEAVSGEHLYNIGIINGETILNQPTDIVAKGEKLIVADKGNHRIKIFTFEGILIQEFGSHGSGGGQFRSPEVLTVDLNGNILVGDSGNSRIQIFEHEGTLVKILGGYLSISGICVSGNFDIIVTDNKSRCLTIV